MNESADVHPGSSQHQSWCQHLMIPSMQDVGGILKEMCFSVFFVKQIVWFQEVGRTIHCNFLDVSI